jgi:hypothetical protein
MDEFAKYFGPVHVGQVVEITDPSSGELVPVKVTEIAQLPDGSQRVVVEVQETAAQAALRLAG